MSDNMCYIIEIAYNHELFYVFNKRILVHNSDMSKKFSSFKAAYSYYKCSEHFKTDEFSKIVKYSKTTKQIIY